MRTEVEDVIGLDASEAVLASAKAGIGIEEILEQIVEKVPAPQGDVEAPLQALSLTLFTMLTVGLSSKCVWLTEWLNQAIRFK